MTASDWKALRVQLETGLLSSQFHQFVKKEQDRLFTELLRTPSEKTQTITDLLGSIKALNALFPNFVNFVVNQIREAEQAESTQ